MANLVAKPKKWKKKAVLFKLEAAGAYGVDTNPTGLVNWIEARNVQFTPVDPETVERNIEMPYMGSSGKINVGNWAKLGFDVALVGSGTKGTAPKYGPLLMSCAFAETITAATSVSYNLVSDDISSGAMYINIDGTLHKLPGTRGSVKLTMAAKTTPMLNFSFDSLYVAPVEQDMPVIDRAGWQIEEGVNGTNTAPASINDVDLSWSAFSWDMGNKMTRVNLPGPQLEVSITDRSPSGEITIVAPALATFNPFALMNSGESVALSVTHGSVAGKKVQVDLNVRISNVAYSDIEGLKAYKLTLDVPPDAGNDEISLTML